MCGIVGIASGHEVNAKLLSAIKRLEYRGYDSVGMAVCSNDGIYVEKDVGKIDEVTSKVDFTSLKGNIGLCHSRWATHGGVTRNNAHPHTDCKGEITLISNGIIENFAELKADLVKTGHKFSSDTDTEVIAHLIEEKYDGDLFDAVKKALNNVEGSYALGVMHPNHDEIIAARKESPLVIGIGDGENMIASDVPAILDLTKKVIYLDNGEIARVSSESVLVFTLEGKQIEKKVEEITWNASQAEKVGFSHFMLKEIFEQPNVIAETVEGKISDKQVLFSEEIKLSVDEIKGLKRIIIVACGTSWHAGIVGEFMLEELARIPTEVEYASEFRYRDPIVDKGTLVIAISQSGETADTLAAIKEAKQKGAKILSIVNVAGSSMTRESDMTLYTKAGPEIGVASTKAFTCQLVILYLITIYFGNIRGHIDEQQVRNRIRDIRLIPAQIQSVLDEADYIELHAKQFFEKKNALYLGRGINYPIALEGALKLKEVSYLHAEGYPAAEMKHGPIALIDEEMPVVVIATKDNRTYKKVLSNIQEVKARGGIVIAIVSKGDEEIKKYVDHNLYVPQNSYILTPLLAVIPMQLFAYYVATMKGYNPDTPKNLAKSCTVE